MRGHKSNKDRSEEFNRFAHSNEWGSCENPETGRVHYRGAAGPGTIEFSYDPDKEEVVNGSVRPIDPLS